MSKKYYWLKLNDNFFEDDTIVWIEEQENGKDYVIFYLKLLLKSLKEEGSLIRYVGEMVIPYDNKALAKLTNTKIDTVTVAMKAFIDVGLIREMDTGELYLTQINEMIGTETDSARRVRKHRALSNIANKPLKALHCNTDVTKCNTEIEKEIDIELEKESTLSTSKEVDVIPYKEILDYLSKVKGMPEGYKLVEGNKKWIRSRWNEGYQVEDFKKVVDNMSRKWLITKKGQKSMTRYLRPETLFGNRFDSYLKEVPDETNASTSRYDVPIL